MVLDDWWKKAGKTEMLLKAAKKGDARSLKLVNRYIKELERDYGIEQITTAYQTAMILKGFVETPRYMPVFRKSYAFDVWADSLILGKTRQAATA